VFVDTAVIAYALGGPHELRGPCRFLVEAAAAGRLRLHASVEMVQELLFHRMRMVSRDRALEQAADVAILCELHEFDQRVLDLMIELIKTVGHLRGRDAVHAATAMRVGISRIVSPDPAFDSIPGLTRIGPAGLAGDLGRLP